MLDLRIYAFTVLNVSRQEKEARHGILRTKLGVYFDSLIGIFQCLGEGDQFHVCSSAVVIASCVCWIAFDTFCVVFYGACEITGLELHISFFTSDRAFLRVDVCFAVFLCLQAFEIAQFIEDIGCSVLREGLLIILDSRW